jgi:hypothetical protein
MGRFVIWAGVPEQDSIDYIWRNKAIAASAAFFDPQKGHGAVCFRRNSSITY